MACPTDLNICFVKGDAYSQTIRIKENGTIVDITGWTVKFTLKDAKTDTTNVYQDVVTSHSNPTQGETIISVPKESSALLEIKTYYYDIETTDTSGSVKTPRRGNCEVTWGIS